jgi:site-specific recombinase XerD
MAHSSLRPWLDRRVELPVGRLLCVIDGQTRGIPWTPAAARNHLRRIAPKAGVRRRFAPHHLRHAHVVEMAREGVPLKVIQRQLGRVNLGITSVREHDLAPRVALLEVADDHSRVRVGPVDHPRDLVRLGQP